MQRSGAKPAKPGGLRSRNIGKLKTPQGWLVCFATSTLLDFTVGAPGGLEGIWKGLTHSQVERDSFGLMQKAGRVGQDC